jgi:hypothetical protein
MVFDICRRWRSIPGMIAKSLITGPGLALWIMVSSLFFNGAFAQSPATEPVAHKDVTFTEFFRRTSGWTAGDGGFSVPLSDGRVLWLFGDSHVNDFDAATRTIPCLFQTRNAAMLTAKGDIWNPRTLTGKRRGFKSWFKDSNDDNVWYWPLCGFQSGKSVYVYLDAFRKTPAGGMWGFENTQTDCWSRIKFPEMEVAAYEPLPNFLGIHFGYGFVQDGPYTYAFGGKQGWLASDLYVARFETRNPETSWMYWNGVVWMTNVAHAALIARGKSASVHVCRVRDRFILTTSAFSVRCDQGKDIYMASSSQPQGPFSELQPVYTIDDTFQGHSPLFYLPVAHPEFINGQDEILVTYCINGYGPCISPCVNDRAIPDHYRPKAIRVPLQLIDPAL